MRHRPHAEDRKLSASAGPSPPCMSHCRVYRPSVEKENRGSANLVAEVDRPLLLTRGVEPQCGVTPWLRKLDRSGALPESIFKHCVSPSPRGDRSDNALHPSQVAA